METAPKIIEPIQQTISTNLRTHLNNPAFDRKQVRNALHILGQPLIGSTLKKLKLAYDKYQIGANGFLLLTAVLESSPLAKEISTPTQPNAQLAADDLYLVCWEHLVLTASCSFENFASACPTLLPRRNQFRSALPRDYGVCFSSPTPKLFLQNSRKNASELPKSTLFSGYQFHKNARMWLITP